MTNDQDNARNPARNQDLQKQAAARAALDRIRPLLVRDAVIGVGTDSTANHFIDALADAKGLFDAAVASSEATADRLRGHGIRVIDLNAAPGLAVYVDGADESDPWLRLIKGGGGALTREKIVAASSESFVCIVDETKCVNLLGTYPLPVEVVPMARGLVARALVEMGGMPEWRQGFVTDNGQIILDVHNLDLVDPVSMERRIKALTGVLEVGLFAVRGADVLVIGGAGGVEVREPGTA